MHATAWSIVAEIRVREWQDQIAQFRLSQEADRDGFRKVSAVALTSCQLRTALGRAGQQLELFSEALKMARRGTLPN
jgi:hypothetical protein